MELQKTENEDWEGMEVNNWEGTTDGENKVRLFVGQHEGPTWSVTGQPIYDVIIDMPHQCDQWEVAYARTTNIPEAIADVEALIKELQEVIDYMKSPRFAEIVKEVESGGTN